MATISTRRVAVGDAEALRAIYNAEVIDSTVTMDLVPRSLADQVDWIRRHSGVHGAVVALDLDPVSGDERILGFASISP